MKQYRVKILRSGGAFEQPCYREYVIEREETEIVSVMNILEAIAEKEDPTLAFFDHAACRQAACGKCMVKVNGKIRLACKEKAEPEMTLEPYDAQKVVRDLLCRM